MNLLSFLPWLRKATVAELRAKADQAAAEAKAARRRRHTAEAQRASVRAKAAQLAAEMGRRWPA